MPYTYDVIIIGAGGAGLMCAIEAGKRGRRVLVLDHSDKIGKKILISGGGRCNFTNVGARAETYQSGNSHFIKSAFGQFSPEDFIHMVEKAGIAYHEKKLGQLFCDTSAQQIVDMLVDSCEEHGVDIRLKSNISTVQKKGDVFLVTVDGKTITGQSLVVATGGLSIPKIGATDFGYKMARQFGLKVTQTMPALVPFTFSSKDLAFYKDLSGISFDALVSCGKKSFRENVLITHRGVSGPAILQISSYWKPGESIRIHMLPDVDFCKMLKQKRAENGRQELKTVLSEVLPKRFVQRIIEGGDVQNMQMAALGDKAINRLHAYFTHFMITPNGTEGYKKAEVTLGGVDTKELDARTLESKKVKGLYFIGEVVDVTGWLGGYNFQWAWASGYAAGQAIGE